MKPGTVQFDRPRKALWISVGLAVAAVAAVGTWWLLQDPQERVRLSVEAQGFPWSRAPGLREPEAGAGAASTASAGQPAASAAVAAAAPPLAVDLCGVGRVVVPGGSASAPDRDGAALPELPAPLGRFALRDAQARMVQTLGGGDARQRVAARLLQQQSEEDPAAQAAWARGLLADALASRDAQALRWAGAACPFVDDDQACRQRLARARVQAEPANALHWLEWANEEPAAADAAWAGLQRAQYWREQPLGLAGVMLRAVPADIAGYLQAALAVDAMAHDVAFPAPPLTPALERCKAKAGSGGSGGGGASDCDRLARLLVERSDSVQALMLGRELGEHIGWPAAQVQRLERETELLQRQENRWAVDDKKPLGCETMEAQRSHIAAVERDGELAVLRRGLAATRSATAAGPVAPIAPAAPIAPIAPAVPSAMAPAQVPPQAPR
jgi:hypothetical protein